MGCVSVPYQLTDTEDRDLCRGFLLGGDGWDKDLGKKDDPDGVGKKALRTQYTTELQDTETPIDDMLEIYQLSLNNTREENQRIWDKFIQRMVSPRISERRTRRRYPWGVWRSQRRGEIPGAPALFGGVVLREDGGFYQIHQYPNLDGEGVD